MLARSILFVHVARYRSSHFFFFRANACMSEREREKKKKKKKKNLGRYVLCGGRDEIGMISSKYFTSSWKR